VVTAGGRGAGGVRGGAVRVMVNVMMVVTAGGRGGEVRVMMNVMRMVATAGGRGAGGVRGEGDSDEEGDARGSWQGDPLWLLGGGEFVCGCGVLW